jgi:hypothetical protein
VDIVEAALIYNHKSHVTKELIKLMQNEVEKIGGIPVERVNQQPTEREKICMELDYTQLFSLFVVKRKISLLRYLFSLPQHLFKFTVEIFIRCLELDASDIAALIYKEFFRLIREVTPHDEEVILTSIVASFSKSNGMIEFKCYLVRQFSERML